MAAAHASSDALVTMAVIPNPDTNRYGGATLDGDVVTGFVPRGHGPSCHFIGVQIAERAAFAGAVPTASPRKRVGRIYPALIAGRPGSVRAFRSQAAFFDIGTPRDYLAACLHFAGGDAVASGGGERARGADAHVEDTSSGTTSTSARWRAFGTTAS